MTLSSVPAYSMGRLGVDYSLYLVTDSRPEILRGRDICDVVEAAIMGGVTIVQFRDKTSDTGELIRIATEISKVTHHYKVPFVINDRVDVALAVDCEGVHIGQDDMKIETVRELLGPDAIIGVSANNLEDAVAAVIGDADYIGIGAVYATPTKTNTKNILGPKGVRGILEELENTCYWIPGVCIGGINSTNAASIIAEAGGFDEMLQGIAVVSDIMGADDPEAAAYRLKNIIKSQATPILGHPVLSNPVDWQVWGAIIKAVHETTPLSHNMTNLVVQNFAANVALAVGASPIMSNNGDEAADLAKLGGALVINMGTVTSESLQNYLKALKAYNQADRPVVFDPVGAGATAIRRSALKTILDNGRITVLKGNEGEILTVYNETGEGITAQTAQQRGVDSTSTLTRKEKRKIVTQLATRLNAVVVMTGKTDFVSDGKSAYAIHNGHEYLSMVTGTGCVLGTTISAMLAVSKPADTLHAVLAAIVLFEVAAETASEKPEVQGQGTFVPAFIDELAELRKVAATGHAPWMRRARVLRLPSE